VLDYHQLIAHTASQGRLFELELELEDDGLRSTEL